MRLLGWMVSLIIIGAPALAQVEQDELKRIAQMARRCREESVRFREAGGRPGDPSDPALKWSATFWQYGHEHPRTPAGIQATAHALSWLRHADQDREVVARFQTLPLDWPAWGRAIDGLRQSAKKNGDYAPFFEIARSLLQSSKENHLRASVHVALGRVYSEQGRHEQARAAFEAALREAPNSTQAEDAELLLHELKNLQVGRPVPVFEAKTIDGRRGVPEVARVVTELLRKSPAAPTFAKDVAPILYKNCAGCHRPGDVAPMSLLDYKSARPWAKSIREAVLTRKMPPWFADPGIGVFSNNPRLSAPEIETIKAWVDGGSIEGSPQDLPPQPVFAEGWRLGKPDLVFDIGQDFVVPPGNDVYKYFTVPTNLTEGKWIRAAQILPGNRQVVHHVHVSLVQDDNDTTGFRQGTGHYWEVKDGLSRLRIDAPVVNDACAGEPAGLPNLSGFEEGSFTAMLPGKQADIFGDSTAKWLPAGVKLRFQIHYAKVDKPQTDRTSVGFYLASGPPATPMRRLDLRNRYFLLPAGAANHEVKRCYEFEADKLLVSITPHMHYRGKDARYEVVHPDGWRETLLLVPQYSFNWQLLYRFQEPAYVEKGSRMIVTFHYDNSVNNASNPDASQAIRWGDRSEDEMMTSWIEYLDAQPASASAGRR